MRARRIGFCIVFTALTATATGCEELGPEARGERQTTALQSIARERVCIPYADIQFVRSGESNSIEVLLRDGTRWQNKPTDCAVGSDGGAFAFRSNQEEICEGDQLIALQRRHQVFQHLTDCTLASFRVM